MKKKLDWEIDFHKFLDKNKNRPFEWGKWDCICMSNEIVKVISGQTLLPKSWQKWKNELEAVKAIMKLSNGKGLAVGIQNAINKTTGWSAINKNFVTKGDLIVFQLVDGDGDSVSAIHNGFGAICSSDDGIDIKSDINITHAWRLADA